MDTATQTAIRTRAGGARWGEARRALPDEGGREGPPVIGRFWIIAFALALLALATLEVR